MSEVIMALIMLPLPLFMSISDLQDRREAKRKAATAVRRLLQEARSR